MAVDLGGFGGGDRSDRMLGQDRSPEIRKLNYMQFNSYWEYLGALTLLLLILHTLMQPTMTSSYTKFIGYLGLAIEATLPLPQILANYRAQSCKGFRVSVLANWLLGDTMKISYYLASEPGKVPWAFKMCGIFQACCDACLGAQYFVYGNGQEDRYTNGEVEKNIRRDVRLS